MRRTIGVVILACLGGADLHSGCGKLIASSRYNRGYMPRSIDDDIKIVADAASGLDENSELVVGYKYILIAVHTLSTIRRLSILKLWVHMTLTKSLPNDYWSMELSELITHSEGAVKVIYPILSSQVRLASDEKLATAKSKLLRASRSFRGMNPAVLRFESLLKEIEVHLESVSNTIVDIITPSIVISATTTDPKLLAQLVAFCDGIFSEWISPTNRAWSFCFQNHIDAIARRVESPKAWHQLIVAIGRKHLISNVMMAVWAMSEISDEVTWAFVRAGSHAIQKLGRTSDAYEAAVAAKEAELERTFTLETEGALISENYVLARRALKPFSSVPNRNGLQPFRKAVRQFMRHVVKERVSRLRLRELTTNENRELQTLLLLDH
jgi:hypothetical protein